MGRKKSVNKTQEYVPKFTFMCPNCNQETKVILEDYKMNKSGDGVIFVHKCLNCKEKFNRERKYADL